MPRNFTFINFINNVSGLCGAVHSSVVRSVRNAIKENSDNNKIICVGDKSRSILQRVLGKHFLFVCQEVGDSVDQINLDFSSLPYGITIIQTSDWPPSTNFS